MDKYYFKRLKVSLYEGKTKDGLSYVLAPSKASNIKYFGILIPKGGLMDEVEIGGTKIPAGIAHLLEHRLFETAQGDTLKKFSTQGAFANAYTTQSCTFFYFATSQGYEEPLNTLFSMFKYFYQTNEKLEAEKPIVLGELASGRDDPSYVFDRQMVKSLYFSSPLKEEIIGTEKSLQSIHLSSVKKFYEQYYSVENLTFFAVGDFNPQEVAKLLNKAGLPSFKKLSVKKYQNDEKYDKVVEPYTEINSPDGQTYLGVGIKFPRRQELYEKFGDDLFAFYEMAGDMVFSSVHESIAKMRDDGLIIFNNGHYLEEAGEDTYMTAFFETNSPDKLKNALEKHFLDLPKAYKSMTSPFRSMQLSFLGSSIEDVGDSEDYLTNLIDGYLNHFAWPALVNRALAFKKNDACNFVKEVCSFPRAYVLLKGKE